MEKSPLNTWVIPYSCVILLCKFILHSIPPLRCLIKALTRKEIIGVALQRLNLKLVCPISSRSSQVKLLPIAPEFTRSLEAKGWSVETQLDHPTNSFGLPLEEFQGSAEELQAHTLQQLKGLPAERKALIIQNSHIGGHRYAGNCIVSPFQPCICLLTASDIHPARVRCLVRSD